MRYIVNLLSRDGFTTGCLNFVKVWYLLWVVISFFSLFLSMYLFLKIGGSSKVFTIFHNSIFLIINSFLYLKITSALKTLITNEINGSHLVLFRISGYLLWLFFLDTISFLAGGDTGSAKFASVKFLEILPEDSVFYSVYLKIYLYIPAVFDFIKPQVEGTTLLVLAAICAGFSKIDKGSGQ